MPLDHEFGIAATRLRPPAPPARLVERTRLDDVLEGAVDRHVPVVLVSAPAGSGKSTLLASWSSRQAVRVAWLQVEDGDSDPARFWSSVVEAIGRQCPSLGARVSPLVIGSQGDGRVIVPALVNELVNEHEQLVVVIDDYHLIDSDSVHRGVERLIDLCPSELTMVLSTRVDPPFRLGRLRVRNQLIEIRAEDLRFATGEASMLLGATTASLSAAMLDELCTRTEGWAAGLVLAGLSLERAADPAQFVEAFRGDNQLVVGYLSDELLAATPAEDRQRLLETSILGRLTGSLVDAVTGSSNGRQWLTATADHNQLVIRLDSTGEWFRYHHLLRDLLVLEAQRTFPDRIPELQRRAAAWFESQNDPAHAVEHRLAAGDVDAAMAAMRIVGPDLLGSGQVRTWRTLLDRIGPAGATDTVCALLWGWCHYLGGRYVEAQESLDTALAVAPDSFDRVIAMPLSINVALGRGDVDSALAIARDVTTSIEDLSLRPAELATAVGAAYAWTGYRNEARAALAIATTRARTDRRLTAHVLALVSLAIVEADDGNVGAARAAAATALDTAQSYGLPGYHGIAPAFAVAARTATDPDLARTHTRHAIELARRGTTNLGLAYVLTSCGDTLLDLGDDDGEAMLAEARDVIETCADPGIASRYLAQATARHQLGTERRERTAALVEQLTDRELAVLKYLPSKLSQREIAVELYVSQNTVKTHTSAIYRKLGVSDRKSAVQAARDLRIL
jgi:LuxR family transcriptional regulator, maltose regulon positive regulatory protein